MKDFATTAQEVTMDSLRRQEDLLEERLCQIDDGPFVTRIISEKLGKVRKTLRGLEEIHPDHVHVLSDDVLEIIG